MSPIHLAVALEGAGWHPAAWREPDAEPHRLLDPRRWTELVQEAERGLLDLVTLEDSLALQSDSPFGPPQARTDQVQGRLDAVLLASRLGPVTTAIGLVPTATTTHTEPFHVSKAIQTLDHITLGRAGWQVKVSGRAEEAGHFGRREIPELTPATFEDPASRAFVEGLFDEAADAVEVVRRLWDSWEDDAIIRDAPTGRFIDRDKLHYIDFDGPAFSVKGPSIVPRSPSGQPVVAALAHRDFAYRLAARSADLVFVTPFDDAQVGSILAEVRTAEAQDRAGAEPLRVLADLVVVLDDDAATARARKARLDELAGQELVSDARIVAGTPTEAADLIEHWAGLGLDGVRLRPAALPHDLTAVTRALVPELQRRGLFRTAYAESTLRERLGLGRPVSRYTAA